MTERQRRTKILATLGPATDPPGVLEDLFRAGVNVVRLNFSHGDPSGQAKRAAAVRLAAQRVGAEVGILADLPGPKIRVERFAEGKVVLKTGDRFDLVANPAAPPGDASQVGVSYLGLPGDVEAGDVLLLDDGLMQLKVVSVEGERIVCTVLNDGVLSDRKGLNKQGGGLSLGALTERDRELIAYVAENIGVDFIAVSFCRNADDMNEARRIAREHGCDAALLSKIERTEAIENLAEIVDASDVVMVARGDLGVEIGDAELPGLQKKIIKESLARNKVVITATQMLQSMVDSPIPTRAEVLDVANAVIDGTDAVMLSAETAAGSYPIKAVEAMARICLGAEKQFEMDTDFEKAPRNLERADQAIAMATMFLSEHIGARGNGAFDHGLQHLRGGDHHFVARQRLADDFLLQAGQLGVADLHAQVSARHHHHVAGVDDLGQVLDGLGAFDLGNQRGVAAVAQRDAARFVHVLGIAAERHGDEVHADLGHDADQFLVALGQRAQRQSTALLVQALAVGEHAVVQHGVDDALAFHRFHPQLHQAVVQQQHIAGLHVAGQTQIAHADLADVAQGRIGIGDQVEAVAGLELHFAFGEFLHPDLRPRQVGQDPDLGTGTLRCGPYGGGTLGLAGGISMREVEAHYVDAGTEQFIQHARRVGGRTQGGENLGTALAIGHSGLPSRVTGKLPHPWDHYDAIGLPQCKKWEINL